jgi:hypothetical protein
MTRRPHRQLGRAVLAGALCGLLVAAATALSAAQRIQFRAQMTVEEYERCGLSKLTGPELTALETWVNQRVSAEAQPSRSLGTPAPRAPAYSTQSTGASDPIVSFNTSSHKYHCPSCRYALSCTKNCVDVRLSEARRRGGVPCGSCGGTCN